MGGDPVPGFNDRDRRLAEMFRNAEKRIKKEDHIPRKKWRVVHCPSCQKKVEYFPKADWRGTLLCPHCGTRFKPPSLDGFVK